MSVDPNWCFENPEEAAREITRLQHKLEKEEFNHHASKTREKTFKEALLKVKALLNQPMSMGWRLEQVKKAIQEVPKALQEKW